MPICPGMTLYIGLYIVYTYLNFIHVNILLWLNYCFKQRFTFILWMLSIIQVILNRISKISWTSKVNWTYVYELWDVTFSQPILELTNCLGGNWSLTLDEFNLSIEIPSEHHLAWTHRMRNRHDDSICTFSLHFLRGPTRPGRWANSPRSLWFLCSLILIKHYVPGGGGHSHSGGDTYVRLFKDPHFQHRPHLKTPYFLQSHPKTPYFFHKIIFCHPKTTFFQKNWHFDAKWRPIFEGNFRNENLFFLQIWSYFHRKVAKFLENFSNFGLFWPALWKSQPYTYMYIHFILKCPPGTCYLCYVILLLSMASGGPTRPGFPYFYWLNEPFLKCIWLTSAGCSNVYTFF